jgi:hypothetical protein
LSCYEFFVQVIHSQILCSTLQKTTNMAYQTPRDLLVPYSWEERDEVYRCIIPIRSWILGIKKLLVRLQNLCDDDLYVWQGLFQQLMTTFKKQSMASTPVKSKVQNLTLEVVELSIGISMSNKYSLKITVNKKWPETQSDLKEDWIIDTCLLQGGTN